MSDCLTEGRERERFKEWGEAVAGEPAEERSESSIEVTGCCWSSETLEDR